MQTWREKIVSVLTGRNDRGMPLWYSHVKVCELLSEYEGYDINERYKGGISCFLTALVKTGHLERTYKPDHLRSKFSTRKEYLYRRTEKPIQRDKRMDRIRVAHDLWREHPELPKWFRTMMM